MAEKSRDMDAKAAPDFTQTPEFAAALQKAVSAATEEIIGRLEAARAETPTPGSAPDDSRWARALAMAIAEVSDQGTSRKRVAPEVLAEREAARNRMVALIVDARARGQVPAYQLKHKVYLDEQIVEPAWIGPDHVQRRTEIDWPGVPNHAMLPINDIAKGIHDEFLRSVGSAISTPLDDVRDMSVTAGGLVIRGGPRSTPKLMGQEAQQTGAGNAAGEGLRLRGRHVHGQITETRVLGTLAPPMRQNA